LQRQKESKQASKQESTPQSKTQNTALYTITEAALMGPSLYLPQKKIEFFLEKDLHSIQSM
jgi:hypothetical protein